MKKSELKRALACAFPAPAPERNRAFLRALPPPPVSHLRLMLGQAGYIRKSAWAISFAVFVLALALGRLAPADAVWAVSALTPFAAVAAVTESARPALYGMEELELSSRFGLRNVVLGRMGVLGLAHLVLLGLLVPLGPAGLLRTGVYLLTPYLLTDLLGLALLRRIRGREGLYVCAGAAVLTAGLALALHGVRGIYAPEGFRWWLAVLAAAACLTGREYVKTMRKMEELS